MATLPVDSNEPLARQVHPRGTPLFYDREKSPPLHPSLFLPSKQDSDGLSLLRLTLRTELWAASRPEQPDVRFLLAHVLAASLSDLARQHDVGELTFQPTPDALDVQHGEPWAHCVINQINRRSYDSGGKRAIKEWAQAVSRLITQESISGPYPPPGEGDIYRPNIQ